MTISTRRACLAAAVIAMIAVPAASSRASLVLYTNRAAFEMALGTPIQKEDFKNSTLNAGLSYTSNSDSARIRNDVFNDSLGRGDNTTFHFSPSVFGVGANFDLSPGGEGLGLALTTIAPGGGRELISSQISNESEGQFFGFISTYAIASLRLTSGTQGGWFTFAESYRLDNLTYGGSAPTLATPEPGTIALAASAVPAGLIMWLRRRKRSQPAIA